MDHKISPFPIKYEWPQLSLLTITRVPLYSFSPDVRGFVSQSSPPTLPPLFYFPLRYPRPTLRRRRLLLLLSSFSPVVCPTTVFLFLLLLLLLIIIIIIISLCAPFPPSEERERGEGESRGRVGDRNERERGRGGGGENRAGRERESRRAKRRRARCGNGMREREGWGWGERIKETNWPARRKSRRDRDFPSGPLPPLPFFSRPMVFPSPP